MKWMLIPAAALLAAACSGGNNDAGTAGRESAAATATTDTTRTASADSTGSAMSATSGTTSNRNLDDASILSQLAQANMMEIQGSKLALKQARSASVKSLAQRLQADHSANLKQGQALASKIGVTATAPDSSAMMSEMSMLQGKTGAAFDSAFVQHEIQDHQKNIDLLQNSFLPAAQNAELKSMIRATIPKLQAHLTAAQAAERKLGGS